MMKIPSWTRRVVINTQLQNVETMVCKSHRSERIADHRNSPPVSRIDALAGSRQPNVSAMGDPEIVRLV
ncbi:hypothetical protein [Novipirellula caenicola]|uniref:Uncharacterized protein n=1 Tax=Novipirellula caenicola TaxID=1536901 RepID=A0ABP9VTT3_9BACT